MTDTEMIMSEQEKRARALERWNNGELPRRTARRIIKRCTNRICKIASKKKHKQCSRSK